jgi:cholinesterase
MAESKFVVKKTEYGPVKGVKKSSILGRDFFSFQTIPYMKAPIGRLRFRDAQPPDAWSEPFDSTVDRPSYCGINFMTRGAIGREDAGILSIHTPYLDRKLPVAVYIHGGGFQYPYGEPDMFGPDFLLQKDICLVLINYRVGPIGFLSLNDPELGIPGNAGLKDQVAALKWVQNNIANFGGDPDNVTVMGTSVSSTLNQFEFH